MNTLVKLGLIWFISSIGYYYIIPIFGFALSYNSHPFIYSIYYLLFSIFAFLVFEPIYFRNFKWGIGVWLYLFLFIISLIIISTFIYSFSTLEQLNTNILSQSFSAYIDIVLSNALFFLPKAFEVLFQDLLITILIIEVYRRYESIKQVQLIYITLFGGMHVLQFTLTGTNILYSSLLVLAAVLTAFIFPYLIINTKGGFIYLFTIHLLFYVFLAMTLRVYMPAGFFI